MKYLLSLMVMFTMCVANAALNNENNPQARCVALGSPSVDATLLGGAVGGKGWRVLSVSLVNGGTVTASDTNYVSVELRRGATVVAELDSRAAHESGLLANTLEPLNLVTAQRDIASGAILTVVYDETDAGTNVALTGAMLCVHYAVK